MYKELLSALAIVLTFFAFGPYIRSILHGQTRPHVFSWLIWGLTTFMVFLATLADRGGAGAWPIGVSALITMYVAWLAYLYKSDASITRIDWIFFSLALSSMPLWYFTADPLWAVVILTTIDVIGFGPTLRKAYVRPAEELLTFYLLMALRNVLAILALEQYSVSTVLFPAMTGAGCVLLIAIVIYRRR